jgi:hypothetical protein
MTMRRTAQLLACLLLLAFPPRSGSSQRRPVRTTPEQVHLSFGDDPKTSIRIVWQSAVQSRMPRVEYGAGRFVSTAPARRVRYSGETGAIYEATISGLSPDTTYGYRVGDPAAGYSRFYQFKTAPAQAQDFVFTAFGDQGTQPASRKNTMNAQRERPAFHLMLGDLAYAQGKQKVWDKYFRMIEPLASAVPFMPTVGNHENEGNPESGGHKRLGLSAYLARLALPGSETSYAFDYAGVRFVCFNTDRYRDANQLKWLETTLAAARRDPAIRWLVVFHHVPLYSSVVKRPNNTALIQVLQPLYDRHRVDLVLCGHNHVYERQFPLRGGQPVSTSLTDYRQREGTVYVVCGGGGDSLYRFKPEKPSITAVRERTFCYLRVSVPARGPLVVEAKRLNGSLIERFRIGSTR